VKQLLFFIFIGCCTFTLQAQVTKRNLLSKFSLQEITSALLSKNDWKPYPKTTAEWKEQVPDSIIQKYIRYGEEALSFEFKTIPASITLEYERNGDREHYQTLSFTKRNKLFDLIVAEAMEDMEDKGRFTEQIINGLWNTCEETYWGIPAHLSFQKTGSGLPDAEDITVDLFGAETAAVVALADYFIDAKLDKISPLLRQRIYYEVNRRLLAPLEKESSRYSYFGGGRKDVAVNNWDPWIVSNWMLANLLLEKDERRRAATVKHQLELLDLYINGLGEDGATDEGPSYWFAAGGSAFDALDLLQSATNNKITIFNQPIIQKMGAYIYKTHIQGPYFINVADASPKLKPNGLMIYRFGKAINDTKMMAFGSWADQQNSDATRQVESFQRMRMLADLSIKKEIADYPAKDAVIDDVWFPDIQLMAARTNNGIYIASHGGHNAESHNHNDVGDFILYDDGYPVIIDVGSGTYTSKTFSNQRYLIWYNASPWHNVPTINGQQQPAGRAAAAAAAYVVYKTNKSETSFSMDLTKAYPATAALKNLTRVIHVNKKNGFVDITDAFDMTKGGHLMQSLMTTCSVDLNTPGKIIFIKPDGTKVTLAYNKNQWTASKEKMELIAPEDKKLITTWDGRDIYRVTLNSTGTSLKTKTVYHLTK